MTAMKTEALRNGVDVQRLGETIGAVRENPALGRFQFRVRNKWIEGGLNRSTIQGYYGAGQENTERAKSHVHYADESPLLLGRDRGANPAEYLLHAVISCMTTTMVYHAASRGMGVSAVKSRIEGDLDLQGFFGLDEAIAVGFQEIRADVGFEGEPTPEEMSAFCRYSPVYRTVASATPVRVAVRRMTRGEWPFGGRF